MNAGQKYSNMNSEKKFSYGTCYYERLSPPREKVTKETPILNIQLDLEQALRLGLALDECIRKVNRYKESTTDGKRAIVNLTIHLWSDRISVMEGRLPKNVKKKS